MFFWFRGKAVARPWRNLALNGSCWRLFGWRHRLGSVRTVHFNGFHLLAHHLEKAFKAIWRVAEIALAGGAVLLEHQIQVVVDLLDAKVDGVGAEMERNLCYAPCVVGRGALAPLPKLPRGFFSLFMV
jgi:hypothetical protein